MEKIGLYNFSNVRHSNQNVSFAAKKTATPPVDNGFSPLAYALSSYAPVNKDTTPNLAPVSTQLASEQDTKMYNELVALFVKDEAEKISPQDNVSRQNKLDALLKTGVLLNKDSADSSSVLESLYKTITTQRAANISGTKIAGQVIDALYDPSTITQKFGDIPTEAQTFIKNEDKKFIKEASVINQEGSGTCVAASVEFHMANKHPAEFARWVEGLSSPNIAVEKELDLSALSKNPMDAIWLLKEFEVPTNDFNFTKPKLILKPDENAIVRAQIQDNFWDMGERTIVDVLMQSTLMQLGSEQTYDSLTDTRAGKFSVNNQGLIEFEKTFIESVVENKERTSIVYQNLDNDQNLIGWNVSLDVIQKHITDAIDSGDDVIAGCVATAEECGEMNVNPNKIVGGHEITITNYRKDEKGNLIFICNDTDDNKNVLVEYPASELIPKIHHASYTVDIVGE